MKLRRACAEGGLEAPDLDQDGRWLPQPGSRRPAIRDALRELAGRVGGTWHIASLGLSWIRP